LNDEECRKKIRMLTLVTVVGQEIPGRVNYSVVQEALNIPEEEVELWILDGNCFLFLLLLLLLLFN